MIQRVATYFFIALLWLLQRLPLSISAYLAKAVGCFLFYVLKRRRLITLINLRLCFPEFTEAQRSQIAKQHFIAYVRSVFERAILWWGSEEHIRSLIQIESPSALSEITKRPTLFLCPHFVSLDVAGVAVAMAMPACSMYIPQHNVVFDQFLRRGRLRFGKSQLFTRQQGIKPVIRAMKQGLPFFILPDMDFGLRDAVFAPFFGIDAATLTAPARIAQLAKAQIVPVIATQRADGRGWCVRFYPAWPDDVIEDSQRSAQYMNEFIEARIRETPEQYFWVHRRFKTRPAGAKSVYHPENSD